MNISIHKKMKNDENSNLEQLQKKYKNLKTGTNVLIGILTVLYVVTVYSSISQKTFDPLLAFALCFSVVVLIHYKKLRTLRAEIESRV